jgi:hypothetical protein
MAATMPVRFEGPRFEGPERLGAEPSPLLAGARASLGELLKARGSGLEVVKRTRTAIETAFVGAQGDAQGNPQGLAVKMALGVCAEADECFKAMDGEFTKLSTALTLLAETREEHGGVQSAKALCLNTDLKLFENLCLSADLKCVRRQVRELKDEAKLAHATLERERKRHETEQLELRHEIEEIKTAEKRMFAMKIIDLDAEDLDELQGKLEDALGHVLELRACCESVCTILPSTKCPIGLKMMTHPVFAADGHSYERSEIERWFAKHGDTAKSPMTSAPLAHHHLVENHTLRSTIREMVEGQMREMRPAGGAGAKRQRAAD